MCVPRSFTVAITNEDVEMTDAEPYPTPSPTPERDISKSFSCPEATWNSYVANTGSLFLLGPGSGFDAVLESEGFGEIALPSPASTPLTNPIHPLFAPSRFTLEDFRINPSLYADIEPALRLTSHMLTSTPVLSYFRTLKYGVEVADAEVDRTYFASADIPSFSIEEANADIMQDLLSLSEKLFFLFTAIKPEGQAQVHGIHYVSQSAFGERVSLHPNDDVSRLPPNDGKSHYIALNAAYKSYFTSSSFRTPTKDMRTCWLLASTLIHELGHAFYARDRCDGFEDYVEPFFCRDQTSLSPELGNALDVLIYGTHLNTIVHPVKGGYIEHWQIPSARKGQVRVTTESHVISPVSSTWLEKWFSKELWQRAVMLTVEEQVTAFRVPQSSHAAVRPDLKNYMFTWKPRREVLAERKGRWVKPVEGYEEKDREALLAACEKEGE
jgi:hypothetical protein